MRPSFRLKARHGAAGELDLFRLLGRMKEFRGGPIGVVKLLRARGDA